MSPTTETLAPLMPTEELATYRVDPDELAPYLAAAVRSGCSGLTAGEAATYNGERWVPVGCWGASGWDLGDWPFAWVYWVRNLTNSGPFLLARYLTGTLTVWDFPTQELRVAALDREARDFWDCTGGPADCPEARGPVA